eukprot:5620175-Pleurochrysis_carterae.AAC.1
MSRPDDSGRIGRKPAWPTKSVKSQAARKAPTKSAMATVVWKCRSAQVPSYRITACKTGSAFSWLKRYRCQDRPTDVMKKTVGFQNNPRPELRNKCKESQQRPVVEGILRFAVAEGLSKGRRPTVHELYWFWLQAFVTRG